MDLGYIVKTTIKRRGLKIRGVSRDVYGSENILTNKLTGRTPWSERDFELLRVALNQPKGWPFDAVVDPRATYGLAPGIDPPNPLGERAMVPAAGRRLFPLLGSVYAAAAPSQSPGASPDDYVEFSDDLFREDRYAIVVRGDSMAPRLQHGDYVLVQPSPSPTRGLIVVAANAEGETCVKTLDEGEDGPVLRPLNPDYAPIRPDGDWTVVGYVVGLRRERGRKRYLEEGDDAGLRP